MIWKKGLKLTERTDLMWPKGVMKLIKKEASLTGCTEADFIQVSALLFAKIRSTLTPEDLKELQGLGKKELRKGALKK